MSQPPPQPRTCSPCTLCCSAPAIAPLHKPAGIRCQFLTADDTTHPPGCSVYHQRSDPKFADCCSFKCLWIQDGGTEFDEADRPDLLGVIFSAKPDADAPHRNRIFITEPTPGAANHPRVQQLIRRFLAQNLTVAVTNPTSVLALLPTGHAWRYQIDPTDPLHARIDPNVKPVPITINGKVVSGQWPVVRGSQ